MLNGELINAYADDKPFPSYLILYYIKSEPLHVVFSFDENNYFLYIITVYYPSSEFYETDNKTRIR